MEKRNVVFNRIGFPRLELEASDDHARHPKENDVRPGYQHGRRVKSLPCLRIHRLVRPEPRRKPGVDGVIILDPVLGITRRIDTDVNFLAVLGFGIWGLGFPIPSGYAVSPPHLAANAPVANVLQPLRVNLFPVRWEETNEVITDYCQRFFCFWVTQEPLFTQARLDRYVAAIA